ncbi:4'-phosphopantetheinyl transferase family protein [Spirosoma montaniterrae]|uniref:Uncharacterized protein n=1 Tax=Spirosoma montaniterrae TaxID=1178516 RepID=A0A1P9WZG0_9BACT|nr:4'-phosphopantetheinyl transferase superfamily protein [Spirosoma montaniterrae]AQG80777.1 hypothetical protein AWR27_16490 [Spirosoma montaniterrae]
MQPSHAPAIVQCIDLPTICWQADVVFSLRSGPAVFRFRVTDDQAIVSALFGMLPPNEQTRAMRYQQPADRLRFVTGRGLLRLLIHRYTGLRPIDVPLVAGHNQKPALANRPDFQFNVSHAGEWLLLAFGHQPIGIDVEPIRTDFAFADMLPTSFSIDEQHWINAADSPSKAFFDLWTRKEALAKAVAKGIDDDFARLPCLTGQHILPAHWIANTDLWHVYGFSVANDYVAALAYPLATSYPQFFSLDKTSIITNVYDA